MRNTNNTNTVNKENTIPYALFVATETNKAFKEISENNKAAQTAFQDIVNIAIGTRQRVADCFKKEIIK
jgi:hypothetical protein